VHLNILLANPGWKTNIFPRFFASRQCKKTNYRCEQLMVEKTSTEQRKLAQQTGACKAKKLQYRKDLG